MLMSPILIPALLLKEPPQDWAPDLEGLGALGRGGGDLCPLFSCPCGPPFGTGGSRARALACSVPTGALQHSPSQRPAAPRRLARVGRGRGALPCLAAVINIICINLWRHLSQRSKGATEAAQANQHNSRQRRELKRKMSPKTGAYQSSFSPCPGSAAAYIPFA